MLLTYLEVKNGERRVLGHCTDKGVECAGLSVVKEASLPLLWRWLLNSWSKVRHCVSYGPRPCPVPRSGCWGGNACCVSGEREGEAGVLRGARGWTVDRQEAHSGFAGETENQLLCWCRPRQSRFLRRSHNPEISVELWISTHIAMPGWDIFSVCFPGLHWWLSWPDCPSVFWHWCKPYLFLECLEWVDFLDWI